MIVVAVFLLAAAQVPWTACAPTADSDNDVELNGQTLIEMGKNLNIPLLKLLGKTLRTVENKVETLSHNISVSLKDIDEKKEDAKKLEIVRANMDNLTTAMDNIVAEMCSLHPCSDWTEWSGCHASKVGNFGGQTRSRRCGLNTTYCERFTESNVEYESKICEQKCQDDYSKTKAGFCVKLYADNVNTRDDAEAVCVSDGGHLMNIDSAAKASDVEEILSSKAISTIWIDGRRQVAGGVWEYNYKQSDPSFSRWYSTEPSNGSSELCKVFEKKQKRNGAWYWWDRECHNKYNYMCFLI